MLLLSALHTSNRPLGCFLNCSFICGSSLMDNTRSAIAPIHTWRGREGGNRDIGRPCPCLLVYTRTMFPPPAQGLFGHRPVHSRPVPTCRVGRLRGSPFRNRWPRKVSQDYYPEDSPSRSRR